MSAVPVIFCRVEAGVHTGGLILYYTLASDEVYRKDEHQLCVLAISASILRGVNAWHFEDFQYLRTL
jgi:hypothetical protein